VPSPPAAAQAERQRRFEVAYAAHHGPVLGYVLRRTASPDDAADVLAETFLTAWRRLEYTGELARIAAALRALPGAERELLALSSWEGLDPGRIAVVLGCSRNAARIRLHRARKRFAAGLAGWPGPARSLTWRPATPRSRPASPAGPPAIPRSAGGPRAGAAGSGSGAAGSSARRWRPGWPRPS
jgi:RNA polymerase sigma-70 factor (ECF subfamily)